MTNIDYYLSVMKDPPKEPSENEIIEKKLQEKKVIVPDEIGYAKRACLRKKRYTLYQVKNLIDHKAKEGVYLKEYLCDVCNNYHVTGENKRIVNKEAINLSMKPFEKLKKIVWYGHRVAPGAGSLFWATQEYLNLTDAFWKLEDNGTKITLKGKTGEYNYRYNKETHIEAMFEVLKFIQDYLVKEER